MSAQPQERRSYECVWGCARTCSTVQDLIDHAWEKHGVRDHYAERDLQPDPTYWIDIETGAWGDASKIVFLTGEMPEAIKEGSDSEIINFGQDNGVPLDRLM